MVMRGYAIKSSAHDVLLKWKASRVIKEACDLQFILKFSDLLIGSC